MAITVKFDDKVRERVGGAGELECQGATVREALYQVSKTYPVLHMFNCDGELRGVLKIRCGGEPVEMSDAVEDGGVLELGIG